MINIMETLRLHGLWLRGESGGARADLTRADLTDAVLTRAVLTGAELRGLRGPPSRCPIFTPRCFAKIGKAAANSTWAIGTPRTPACGTSHCRAGWAIHLAGKPGRLLERLIGPAGAGAIITAVSCPYLERVPDFYCSNEAALVDIQRCAAIEAEQGGAQP